MSHVMLSSARSKSSYIWASGMHQFFLHEYKHTPEDPIDVQGYKTSVSLKSLDIY